jgi:hypothetical protein
MTVMKTMIRVFCLVIHIVRGTQICVLVEKNKVFNNFEFKWLAADCGRRALMMFREFEHSSSGS